MQICNKTGFVSGMVFKDHGHRTVVEETPDEQHEDSDDSLNEDVFGGSKPRGEGGGRLGRVRSGLSSVSGVGILEGSPSLQRIRESASKKKRDRRRSDLPNRDEFLEYLHSRSPPSNKRLGPRLILDHRTILFAYIL